MVVDAGARAFTALKLMEHWGVGRCCSVLFFPLLGDTRTLLLAQVPLLYMAGGGAHKDVLLVCIKAECSSIARVDGLQHGAVWSINAHK